MALEAVVAVPVRSPCLTRTIVVVKPDTVVAWISVFSGKRCLVTGSTGGSVARSCGSLSPREPESSRVGGGTAPGVGEEAGTSRRICRSAVSPSARRGGEGLLGGLDVLVNNVGVARHARFEDVPDDEWDAYWQLNVMSYVRAIRAALPHLCGGGVIVNVSSTAGKRPSTACRITR